MKLVYGPFCGHPEFDKSSVCTLPDLSPAFDSINHGILTHHKDPPVRCHVGKKSSSHLRQQLGPRFSPYTTPLGPMNHQTISTTVMLMTTITTCPSHL